MHLPAQWELARLWKKWEKKQYKLRARKSFGSSKWRTQIHCISMLVRPRFRPGVGVMEGTWERRNIGVFWLGIVNASPFSVFFFSSWHWKRELTNTWNQSLPVTADAEKKDHMKGMNTSLFTDSDWIWSVEWCWTVCLFRRPRVSASALQRNSHQPLRGWTEAWQVSDGGMGTGRGTRQMT